MDQEMTVDRRPEQNGHVASGQAYDKPAGLQPQSSTSPQPRRLRLRAAQIVTSAVLAVTLALVVRRIVEAPDE